MSLTYPKHQCTVRIRPNIRKSGDPKSTLFAEQPASMLPRLFPPVKAFNLSYSQALFTQLNAILALNGVTAPPVMHAVLLNAHPVAASSFCHVDLQPAAIRRLLCCGAGLLRRNIPVTSVEPPRVPSDAAVAASGTCRPAAFFQPRRPFLDYGPFYRGSGHRSIQSSCSVTDLSTERFVSSQPSTRSTSRVPAFITPSLTSMARDTAGTSDSMTTTSSHTLELPRTLSHSLLALPLRRLRHPHPSTSIMFQQHRHYVRFASSDQQHPCSIP